MHVLTIRCYIGPAREDRAEMGKDNALQVEARNPHPEVEADYLMRILDT